MLAPVTHILALTTIVRERLLPVPGTVTAKPNQRVTANDMVAEAHWAREHVLIDVARTLGISNAAADKLIRCKVGDELAVNTLVATGRGLLPHEVRAPREGRVAAAGGGQVLLEVGDVNIQLRAGIPGVVTQVSAARGVTIQAAGSLIQGVWGNGRMEVGVMVNLMDKPDAVLEAGRLDMSLRGSVILGGCCRETAVLQAAAELPVRGLILSSLHPGLLTTALQMRYPIVVIDGLGLLPMNPLAFKLLTTSAKREVSVNAEAFNRYSGARPEVIIPLPVSQEPPLPNDMETFAPGQRVRLRAAPHRGAVATLENLRPGLSSLPNGLRAPCADVRTEAGEVLIIPLSNMEVVG